MLHVDVAYCCMHRVACRESTLRAPHCLLLHPDTAVDDISVLCVISGQRQRQRDATMKTYRLQTYMPSYHAHSYLRQPATYLLLQQYNCCSDGSVGCWLLVVPKLTAVPPSLCSDASLLCPRPTSTCWHRSLKRHGACSDGCGGPRRPRPRTEEA